jgi:predicted Zn-dependent protease
MAELFNPAVPARRIAAGRSGAFLARLLMLVALSFAAVAQPATAQSILRDAETEALLRDMSRPLIEAAPGLEPENVQVVLIHDQSINAFVAGGQIVYLHSGLITSADNANEVQGVIAHELGHITGGHMIRLTEGVQQATGIMILSLILGAAAMAAGAGEAGMGVLAAGQQAAMGRFLAFSRIQESSADAAGAAYLSGAGISGRGSLAFFERLQNIEFRMNIPQDGYARTHPLNSERLSRLSDVYHADPAWDRPTEPALEERFQRVRAKLFGFVEDPRQVMNRYPESDGSIPAHYARAYAWHRSAHPDRALAEVESLLQVRPNDPYFLELKGQILLESGRPAEALESLRQAVTLVPDQPLIAALFGHALIATEDSANLDEAKRVLRVAVQRDNDNPFAWYQLGIVYDREGDRARAALATAERYNLTGQPQLALANAEQALMGIPVGTPDWLRAQDIAMVSRSEVQRQRDRDR